MRMAKIYAHSKCENGLVLEKDQFMRTELCIVEKKKRQMWIIRTGVLCVAVGNALCMLLLYPL